MFEGSIVLYDRFLPRYYCGHGYSDIYSVMWHQEGKETRLVTMSCMTEIREINE